MYFLLAEFLKLRLVTISFKELLHAPDILWGITSNPWFLRQNVFRKCLYGRTSPAILHGLMGNKFSNSPIKVNHCSIHLIGCFPAGICYRGLPHSLLCSKLWGIKILPLCLEACPLGDRPIFGQDALSHCRCQRGHLRLLCRRNGSICQCPSGAAGGTASSLGDRRGRSVPGGRAGNCRWIRPSGGNPG